MVRIIFITGAPGSGKSTIADLIAKKLNIDHVVGTDTVREILRTAISKDACPTLHTSAILACDDAPEGEDKFTWGFEEQARNVSLGIKAVVRRAIKENRDLIMEGIHLIPGLLNESEQDIRFNHFVLTVKDETSHKGRMLNQGEHRSTYKISNYAKAKSFQELLIRKAKKFNATIINNDELEIAVKVIFEVAK